MLCNVISLMILISYGIKYKWNVMSNFFVWCRFNGEDFLNKWKGKKIMFVGDSLSLNMWESLSCMIHASVPNATTSFSRKETISTVIFQVIVVLLCLSLVFQMLLLMIHFFFMNIIFHVCLSSIFILLCLFLYYIFVLLWVHSLLFKLWIMTRKKIVSMSTEEPNKLWFF
jgi:hypothetical protein